MSSPKSPREPDDLPPFVAFASRHSAVIFFVLMLAVASFEGVALFAAKRRDARSAAAAPVQAADAVYRNARVWTGDSAQPAAEALVLRDGRLLYVGSSDSAARYVGPNTVVLDLEGRRVVPGFIDAHWHLSTTSSADLNGAGSVTEIASRLAAWAVGRSRDAWIVGRGWTATDFPDRQPHRRHLDALYADRPVLLTDRDGHQVVVNSAALRLANITRASQDPDGGRIVRDADGSPTGVLQESAASLVRRLVPPPTPADIARRIDELSRDAAALGITMVQEMSGRAPRGEVFDALREAAAADSLRLRWYVSVPFSPDVADSVLRRYVTLADSLRGPWLRFWVAKGMLDGTVDARTAAMLSPYVGTTDRGLPFMTDAALRRGVQRYDSAGLQVALHAIGDRAIRQALDAFEAVQRTKGVRDTRHRIEHVEVPDPQDVPRFRTLGVVASTQALFATPDVTTLQNYAPLLGPERAARSNHFKQFDDAGVVQAFGSDHPVFPMHVMRGIHVAVNRTTVEGTPRGGWYPDGRITLDAALRHFTRDAAYAAFLDAQVGTLRAGMLADFVVLDRDPFALPTDSLFTVQVERTVVGGRTSYLRGANVGASPAGRPMRPR